MADGVFIVGAPRSGTTLLQSFLAAHPEVVSFPESKYFTLLDRRPRTGLVSRRAPKALADYGAEIGLPSWRWTVRLPTLRACARGFDRLMATAAEQAGARVWVEKTPRHLYSIETIEKHLDVRFLHVVRDGEDVVASLCETSRQHPEVWDRWTPETAVDRWNEAVAITASYLNRPNHMMVRYEELADPATVLPAVCEFVGVEFTEAMIDGRAEAAVGLVRGREAWKADNLGPLRFAPGVKVEQVFDAETRRFVRRRLAPPPTS